jgi:hypothetical protein
LENVKKLLVQKEQIPHSRLNGLDSRLDLSAYEYEVQDLYNRAYEKARILAGSNGHAKILEHAQIFKGFGAFLKFLYNKTPTTSGSGNNSNEAKTPSPLDIDSARGSGGAGEAEETVSGWKDIS